jgi:ribose/xylose/arabinose/galactoside ABC-type transport system permease subunit
MTNKKAAFRLWVVFGACALFIFALQALFVVSEAQHIVREGFPLKNIITGVLPESYDTGQGSSFNAIRAMINLAMPVVIFFAALSVFFFWLDRRKRLAELQKFGLDTNKGSQQR